MPDQQMRPDFPRYPVDRYLVESSKKIEMVNFINDEIWNTEPALRPEDEIILRKLHDMLQSTADDLKLLSGEMAKFREPQVQEKSQPTPLDEDFNEKVHIEELVNAKFHNYKIIDKLLPVSSESKPNKTNESLAHKAQRTKVVNAGVQVNPVSSLKKTSLTKHLHMTRPKIAQIKEDAEVNLKGDLLLNNGKPRKDTPTVHYNELSYKYDEPKDDSPTRKPLQIQKMPDVNIRSELKQQKVLLLDIMPETRNKQEEMTTNNNVGVISVQHENFIPPQQEPPNFFKECPMIHYESSKQPVRKVSKMSTCDSSESANNVSSDGQHRLNVHKQFKLALKTSPKSSARNESKNKRVQNKNKQEKRTHLNLDEWKKKLNAVYGQPSSSMKSGSTKQTKISPKKSNLVPCTKPKSNQLNNAEYIPYTQLTLGGVRVSDIERELLDIPNRNNIPLSPILDKILSRENSFHKNSPRNCSNKDSPIILTTSDENLLLEVIDIKKTVSKTLAKNIKESNDEKVFENMEQNIKYGDNDDVSSYVDDFEDDKSDQSSHSAESVSKKSPTRSLQSNDNTVSNPQNKIESDNVNPKTSEANVQNATYTKVLNLSFKNPVDIFEFVHSVDTQDTGTQSNTTSKISLKETQTSPRNEKSNIQPIHNDLWPCIDPKGEVENLFELEKEFIKKLILQEYGDILEKNINKPSTSKDKEDRRNVAANQKNTQTSPAHVKSIMTSPTRTKTQTTSPFSLSLIVDRQNSPMIQMTNEEDLKIEIANEIEDLGISVNLSSPRFSLRLPQTSREVLSNLDGDSRNHSNFDQVIESKTFRKYAVSSSSSVDADNSSSEMSSLGEVKLKLKRKLKKNRVLSISESSTSSMITRHSSGLVSVDILPLKSEGEVSLGQLIRKPRRKRKESDGEINL